MISAEQVSELLGQIVVLLAWFAFFAGFLAYGGWQVGRSVWDALGALARLVGGRIRRRPDQETRGARSAPL